MKFPEPGSQPSASAATELLAEVAAMEFLFPYKERVKLRESAEKNGEPLNFESIAKQHMIPQVYVERFLSEPWMDYLGALLDER